MTRIQITCYILIASAIMLSGMLLARVTDQFAPMTSPASADMINERNGVTMVTARTASNGEESLFIIDDASNLMLVYRVQARGARGGKVELVHAENLGK